MELIPALDLRGGRVVRLRQGDFGRETVYPETPAERARAYAAAGARRLHVVDLDAASGTGENRALVAELVAGTGLAVQVAGGVRTATDAGAWLGAGAAAVVMGTTAVRRPDVLRAVAAANPGRVLAALDVREGRPAVTGWTALEARPLADLLGEWDALALAAVILTSIERDGTLEGPDLETMRRVGGATRHPVIYSGGIGSLDDLAAVAAAGASAVILGRSLLEGRFGLEEAMDRCAALS